MKSLSTFILVTALLSAVITCAAEITGRFAPEQGKVLVFVGQDNTSIGGTVDSRDGYVENIGIPAGISHYIHFSEGWSNAYGYTFPKGQVAGLNSITDWGAGPMNLKAYLESPMLDRCIFHVAIAMAGGSESKIADGSFDHLIEEFTAFVADHQDHPFLVRIGHEFGEPGDGYDPGNFRKAFRRIVDALRADKLPNVAVVFAASTEVKAGQFEEFDPGSNYYDWIGYSWWGGENDGRYALEFARKVKKPAIITEASPLGKYLNRDDNAGIWNHWFEPFFQHIEANTDVVRAISYINADWDSHEMWEGRGMTKIESAPEVLQRWQQKMNSPRYLNSADKPFTEIGFPAPYAEPEVIPVEPYAVYKDPDAPIPDRVSDLLKKMTLEEKIAQLTGWRGRDERNLRGEGRIFEKDFYAEIAPHGIGSIGPVNLNIEEDIRQSNAIREFINKDTRLGIPALRLGEANHGLMRPGATAFPVPVAVSSSWNPALIGKLYRHAGKEARSRGIHHLLSPDINITLDPRWGRVAENISEDPFLTGRLGAAMVEGLEESVATTLRHFAGYGNTCGGRNRTPYNGGKRQLLDTEIEPFRYIIKTANPAAIMPGHHDIDGVPCHINSWLLKNILRRDLGFQGLIASDVDAIARIHEKQKIGKSSADVAAMAINAGIQLELSDGTGFQHLVELVDNETINLSTIDNAVGSVLSLKFSLGLFETQRLSFNEAVNLTTSEQTTELATEAARQSIVLLKNDGILPLDQEETKTIAVIGPNASVCRLGSRSGTPARTVSLLDGIKAFCGDNTEVTHAPGCIIALNDTHDSYLNWRHVNDVNFVSPKDNQPVIDEAVAVAKEADIVILALGENELLGRESWSDRHLGDRSSLDLTESQIILAESILAIGKPVILYLTHGRPITLGKLGGQCNAILTGYYTGQETGTAAAEILFGEAYPSGKLTVSWPRSVGHLPAHYNQPHSDSFDYIESSASAIYPFGHGLSYTSFEYSDPTLSTGTISSGKSVDVFFELTNTGSRSGTEIAQVYVSGEGFSITRPALELKGFQRVKLDPGESRIVTVKIDADDLHFHNAELQRVLPEGVYQIRIGGSSDRLSHPVPLKVIAKQSPSITAADSPARQPNIVFMMIDDLRPESGIHGTKLKTPHIDRLAAAGMRFDRAYCQQALGESSRLSMMSGLYPLQTGKPVMMNQYFGTQGYETTGLGKITVDDINWSQWIDIRGSDYVTLESIEAIKSTLESETLSDGDRPPKGPLTEIADVPDDTWVDGKRGAKIADILSDPGTGLEKPFFLAVGFSKPQLPFAAPAKYWNLYNRDDFALPTARFAPPGYPDFGIHSGIAELEVYSDFEASFPNDMSQRLLHGYAACVSYIDSCVGTVLKALDASGFGENTVVVLAGNNGFKLGDHGSWGKGTCFETDTRVPLIIRAPGVSGGKSTSRIVELIDLYPTLCELAGIETPEHCEGRSFRRLLQNPDETHRDDAYSISTNGNHGIGHSIRTDQYRYTEWHSNAGEVTHRILTDVEANPDEVSNLVSDRSAIGEVAAISARLKQRILEMAPRSNEDPNRLPDISVALDISPQNLRQTIDGFGGSITSEGTIADDEALQIAINGLDTRFIRAHGEVSADGNPEHNRDVLSRAMKIDPGLEVILAFSQPQSEDNQNPAYWLREIDLDGENHYELRPERETEWAIEMALRTRQYIEWGINVKTISIQNEPNISLPGMKHCRWHPDRLADFIESKVQLALNAAGLRGIKIAGPDLAHLGHGASEVERFIPVITSRMVDIVAYHMNDSCREGEKEGSLDPLVNNTRAMANLRNQYFPEKPVWMTETSGAQYSNGKQPAYGWSRKITEHEKAIKAARYLHTALTEAEANAFLWNELVFRKTTGDVAHGLVLVDEKQENGQNKFLATTGKFYAFRQFSGFVKPGYRRIHLESPDDIQISAFLSDNEKMAVAIAVNDTPEDRKLVIEPPRGMTSIGTFQTDELRNCSPVDSSTPLPAASVRTLVFSR